MSDTRRMLGLSDQDYERYLELSQHRCWICGEGETIKDRRLAVDHDHDTCAIRGFLCTRCNRRLGAVGDRVTSAEWLRRAADYLEGAWREFSDGCELCSSSQCPSAIVESDGEYTLFRYACKTCKRSWTCTYRTRGVPMAWLFSGVPVPGFCAR